MPHLVAFHSIARPSYFEYHLPMPNRSILVDSVYNYRSLWSDKLQNTLHNYGVDRSPNEENALLYSFFIQQFLSKNASLQWLGSAKEIMQVTGLISEVSQWSHTLQYMGNGTHFELDHWGIATAKEFVTYANYSQSSLHQQGYQWLPISTMFLPDYVKLYGADVTNWVFWNPHTSHQAPYLAAKLQSNTRPTLPQLLQFADTIHLQMGEDEGYHDYIMLLSKHDYRPKITHTLSQLHHLASTYEQSLTTCSTSQQLLTHFQKFAQSCIY